MNTNYFNSYARSMLFTSNQLKMFSFRKCYASAYNYLYQSKKKGMIRPIFSCQMHRFWFCVDRKSVDDFEKSNYISNFLGFARYFTDFSRNVEYFSSNSFWCAITTNASSLAGRCNQLQPNWRQMYNIVIRLRYNFDIE